MIQIRFTRSLLAVVAVAAGFAAQPALAGAPVAPTAEIKLAPATLAGDDSTIHARIEAAARKVCRADSGDHYARLAARECYTKAVRTGEAQLVALRQTARGTQQALAAAERPKVR